MAEVSEEQAVDSLFSWVRDHYGEAAASRLVPAAISAISLAYTHGRNRTALPETRAICAAHLLSLAGSDMEPP